MHVTLIYHHKISTFNHCRKYAMRKLQGHFLATAIPLDLNYFLGRTQSKYIGGFH